MGYRGGIRTNGGLCELVSVNIRFNNKPDFIKDSISCDIYWSKFDFFSNTFFRIGWHTPTILRLHSFLFYEKRWPDNVLSSIEFTPRQVWSLSTAFPRFPIDTHLAPKHFFRRDLNTPLPQFIN